MTTSSELPDLPDVPDAPESTSPDAGTVIGLTFVGALVSLVPVLGAMLLYGIGLAMFVSGNSKRKGATAQRKHGPILEAGMPVSVGQTITVEGAILPGKTVVAPLSGETAALVLCCGYHQTDNIGNRSLLFRRTIGDPLEIACAGRVIRLSGERAELLSKNTTKKASDLRGWGESPVGRWFSEAGVRPQQASGTHHMTAMYEFEEVLVMPGDSVTATGIVSAITDLEPGEMVPRASLRKRLSLSALPDGTLELTTLQSSELAANIAQGKGTMIAGVVYEVLAVASSVAWYRIFRG